MISSRKNALSNKKNEIPCMIILGIEEQVQNILQLSDIHAGLPVDKTHHSSQQGSVKKLKTNKKNLKYQKEIRVNRNLAQAS